MPNCPHCDASIPRGLRACPECDQPLRPQRRGSGSGSPGQQKNPRRKPPANKSQTPLYIGLGLVGSLVILVVVFFLVKGGGENGKGGKGGANTPPDNRRGTKNHIKQIGLALHNYHDSKRMFPPGKIANAQGQIYHGWQTRLLPYLDQQNLYSRIDFNVPWDDPKNVEWFQYELKQFCRDGSEPMNNSEGWGISHFAGNEKVLFQNSGLRFRDVTDGTTNTIGFGEVVGDFSPWGHPKNYRDPSKGINKGASSFGNPNYPSAMFMLLDGSVREISEDIDQETLRRLADPNDGKPVGEF